jgi:transcriptional regulator with XRE-family HTH domain
MLLHIKKSNSNRASQLVRQARRSGGLTQRALAAKANISQPVIAAIERSTHDATTGTLDRLLGATGFSLTVLPTTRASVGAWGEFISKALRDPERGEEVAFRALIGLNDDLNAVDPALRVALSVAPPAPSGDARFDAAIAAMVEHHLGRGRLPIPEWVFEGSRFLEDPWSVYPYPEGTELAPAFRRHGVFLAVSELASV